MAHIYFRKIVISNFFEIFSPLKRTKNALSLVYLSKNQLRNPEAMAIEHLKVTRAVGISSYEKASVFECTSPSVPAEFVQHGRPFTSLYLDSP
jgi:hypothetical protein